MPVQTRSQTRKLLPIDEKPNNKIIIPELRPYYTGYKIVEYIGPDGPIPIVATLEIPYDIPNTIPEIISKNNLYKKYRCQKALVREFTDLNGQSRNDIRSCRSRFKPFGHPDFLNYNRGEWVVAHNYNTDTNEICGAGIHFFLCPDAVDSYYIRRFRKGLIPIKIMPTKMLVYPIYNSHILNREIKIFDIHGNVREKLTYIGGLLHYYYGNGFITQFEFISKSNSIDEYAKSTVIIHTITYKLLDCDKKTMIFDNIYTPTQQPSTLAIERFLGLAH